MLSKMPKIKEGIRWSCSVRWRGWLFSVLTFLTLLPELTGLGKDQAVHEHWEKQCKTFLWNQSICEIAEENEATIEWCFFWAHISSIVCWLWPHKESSGFLTASWGSEGSALCPIIHHCVEDGLVNPQCHCSQTTVEIEVSKCTVWRH